MREFCSYGAVRGAVGNIRPYRVRPETRTIRRRVLSVHNELVVVASKIAAVHHERGGFRWLSTAFGPTASVGTLTAEREF